MWRYAWIPGQNADSARRAGNGHRYLAALDRDGPDYRGFAGTIADVLTWEGRAVLGFNNPYGGVIHRHVTDYFDSGAISPYRGMWTQGIKTYHHHRTLEDYLDAFLDAGLRLTKLADLRSLADDHPPYAILPGGVIFPRFMLLGFAKPA